VQSVIVKAHLSRKYCLEGGNSIHGYLMTNASNTHFLTPSLPLTCLLDEINICPTILWGFNFQSV